MNINCLKYNAKGKRNSLLPHNILHRITSNVPTKNFDFAGITSWTGCDMKWRRRYALTSKLHANGVGA